MQKELKDVSLMLKKRKSKMQMEMDYVINFIDKYGEDYLEDGTKEVVLTKLRNGDIELLIEIMNAIDHEWVSKVEEQKKFRLFREMQKNSNDAHKKGYCRSSYMDCFGTGESDIPALRYVVPMEKGQIEGNCFPLSGEER